MNAAPCVFCSSLRDRVHLLKRDQLAALSCTLMSRHSVHLLYVTDEEKKHTVSRSHTVCSSSSWIRVSLAKVNNRGE